MPSKPLSFYPCHGAVTFKNKSRPQLQWNFALHLQMILLLIITGNAESLQPYLRILDCFGAISGMKLNREKTKAVWLGSMKDSNSKIFNFKATKEPIKMFGVHLSNNTNKCIEANFYTKINKMKTKLNLWLMRDLTIILW